MTPLMHAAANAQLDVRTRVYLPVFTTMKFIAHSFSSQAVKIILTRTVGLDLMEQSDGVWVSDRGVGDRVSLVLCSESDFDPMRHICVLKLRDVLRNSVESIHFDNNTHDNDGPCSR